MTWFLILACTSSDTSTTGDSGTATDSASVTDSTTGGTDSGDTDTVQVSGALTGVAGTEPVTTAVVTATLDAEASLTLLCEGETDSSVPEILVWTSAAPATDHQAAIPGLLADTTYTCSAHGQPQVTTTTFTTGPIPQRILDHGIVLGSWDDSAELGWALLAPFQFVTSNSQAEIFLVVVDMAGQIRWYLEPGSPDGILAFDYNAEDRLFWAGGGLVTSHRPHRYDEMAATVDSVSTECDHDADWFGDSVYSFTRGTGKFCIEQRRWADDSLVWDVCGDELGYPDLKLNSLDVLEVDGSVRITAGSASDAIVVSIDRDSEQVMWEFTPTGDFNGVDTFSYNHDVNTMHCDGYDLCLMYLDNGKEVEHSQAILWGLDESTMTATKVRAWEDEGWYEERMGSVQVLEEGNWFVGRGHLEHLSPGGPASSVVEVDDAGDIVWQLDMGDPDRTTYRARKVPACDLFFHAGYCPELTP